jgi:hypothetical protein
MAVGRVNYGSWFVRVLAWDGLVPVCVVLIPNVIKFLFPNNRGVLELMFVLTPVIALVLRMWIGSSHIATNYCSPANRRIQFWVLFFGITVLGFIDAVLIHGHLMPKGPFNDAEIDVGIVLFSVYLGAMTIAMYPGRANSQDDTHWPEDVDEAQEM